MWAWLLGALCQRGTFLPLIAYCLSRILFLRVLVCSLDYLFVGGHENRVGGDEDGVLDTSPGKIRATVGRPGKCSRFQTAQRDSSKQKDDKL